MAEEKPFEVLFNGLCSVLKDEGNVGTISKDYMNLKNDLERMKFLLGVESVQKIIHIPKEITAKLVSKSVDISKKKRDEGNVWFQKNEFQRALRLYTESLAFAPMDYVNVIETQSGECRKSDAAIAFANRSAVLFHMNEYSLCLQDISESLKLGYPSELVYKVCDRQARCLLCLDRPNDAIESFKAALSFLKKSNLDSQKMKQWENTIKKGLESCNKVDETLKFSSPKPNTLSNSRNVDKGNDASTLLSQNFLSVQNDDTYNSVQEMYDNRQCVIESWRSWDDRLKTRAKQYGLELSVNRKLPECGTNARNHIFPSLSDAASVIYTEDKGRHIIAARDINPGEVILIEEPYSAVLLPDQLLDHCSYCFQPSLAPLPCKFCHTSMYCSKLCQAEAALTHSMAECRGGLYELLYLSGVDKFACLAVSAVVRKPFKEHLENWKNGKEIQNSCKKLLLGCSADFRYHSNEYSSICSLVTNDSQRNAHDLFRRGIIAVYLLSALQSASYYTDINTELSEENGVNAYIGSLLLSHLQSFPCNAHEIPEFNLNPRPGQIATSMPHELGAAIYGTLSLFNHSCDPAVTRNFYGRTCIVRTIRYVRAGEELADNYGALFALEKREDRRARLAKQYLFECMCEACVENWDMFGSKALTGPPKWRCTCYRDLKENISDSQKLVSDTVIDKSVHINASPNVGMPHLQNLSESVQGNTANDSLVSEVTARVNEAENKTDSNHVDSKYGKTVVKSTFDKSTAAVCDKKRQVCECKVNTGVRLERLKQSHLRYKIAFDLLLAGKAAEALPVFIDHLKLLDELVCRPWGEYCACQEAIKQCFSLMGNCCIVDESCK